MTLKTINFFDGYDTSVTPNVAQIDVSSLLEMATDNDYVINKGAEAAGGDIYYNTTDNVIRYHNGTIWITLIDSSHSTDTTIHFAKDSIDHTEILSIGSNTHEDIDEHIAATAAHGVAGDIVGTSDSQSLSNKSFTDPITFSELSTTPTTPASGKQKIYPKDDGKFYRQDSSGKESLLGAGGGGVDFLSDVEATAWLSYKDTAAVTPIDGTGGTATVVSVALEEDTGDVLSDGDTDKTFVITKASGDGQGEGIGVEFSTRGPIDFSAGRLVKIYAITSADYDDNDFRIYVYDTDNNVLIDTFQRDLKATLIGGEQIFQFQTSSNSANYRLIFHCATTNADAYTIKLLAKITDSGMAIGSPITDWVAYTPTVSGLGAGGATTLAGAWRRVGDSMEITISFVKDGTNGIGTDAVTFSLPNGHSISPGTLISYGTSYNTISAFGGVVLAATASFNGIGMYKINQAYILSGQDVLAGSTIRGTIITPPIAGWSSNVVMSETMPGRDVVLVLEGNGSTQSIPHEVDTKVTNWAVVKNPANIWDAANSQLTIPESGYYSLSAQVRYNSDPDHDVYRGNIQIWKNGSILYQCFDGTNFNNPGQNATPDLSMAAHHFVKGDVIAIYTRQYNIDSDNNTIIGSFNSQRFSLAKLNTGNQTIGLEETVLQKVSAVSNPNLIINGGFDLWQRGTSQTTSGYGSDDRWSNIHGGTTKTHSRQTSTDTERVFFNAPYYSRTIVSTVAGVTNNCQKIHNFENVAITAGKTVTLSFWAKADASKNIAVEFFQVFGTGGSPSSSVSGIGAQKIALTTTWQKKVITVAIPSIIGKTLGTDGIHTTRFSLDFWFDAGSDFNARTASLGQQSGTFDIAEVKLEIGSVATPFSLAGGNIAGELAMAQRYYVKGESFALVQPTADGGGAYRTFSYIPFPVTMRVAPTTITINSYVAGTANRVTSNFNAGVYGGAQTDSFYAAGATGVTAESFVLAGTHNANGYFDAAKWTASAEF